ncbi:MAG: GMC family oxidoreductase N-terminal domain-containing protein, partial [Acetobacteraceae bacterium]
MDADSDYLVVGGGTAGCIVAARLSEDPACRVTLLEAGPEDSDIWIHIPAGYARMFIHKRYDWQFATEPEPELNGRSIAWPRGRVLGGSGSINGLVYLRGSPHDYDRWAQAGARGWSHEDVLPAFRRIEDWTGASGETRGHGGPVTVSEPRSLSPGAAAFLATCDALGFPRCRDMNDGAIEGSAPVQMNVRRGWRRSTARAYLHPARGPGEPARADRADGVPADRRGRAR